MKNSTSFVAGLATAGLVVSLAFGAGAATREEMIKAEFADIKIVMDGQQLSPKDANGKAVEPFIWNGTTYLPVRAVGAAVGKDVSWDGDTKTVYLGAKPSASVGDKFDQFKSALTEAGYEFEEVTMAANLVGATKGVKYKFADGSSVELYQFDTTSEAYKKAETNKELAIEGIGTIAVEVKDGFALYTAKATDASLVLKIFNSLK